MKTVLLVFTIIAFANTDGVVEKSKDSDSNVIIRQLFETLKYFIKNGCDEDGFPTTDPFEFEYKYYEFYLPKKLLSLQAAFTNGVIFGLSNFNVQHAKFIKNEIAIELCVNLPLVTFHSDSYEINGDIYEIMPIIGKGNFEFVIHNFTFSGKVFLKRSDDERSILIKNIHYPQFSIQQIVSRVEFDNNIDDIANSIINDLLAEYLTRFNQFIAKKYNQYLINFINPFLNNFDSWRLLSSQLCDYHE